ncbi:WAT1-related protein At1g21890-like [Cucurbita moschata]|uniref:WAT1-related protein n=1 Tax=Cucurbita moschata TaxID=3662 RepID=A0A6J1H1N0_CUCMO|nr:WAT1-related protein At1g21890-like [Cucurbita moschata]
MEICGRIWRMMKIRKAYFAVVFLQASIAVMYTIVAISLKHGLNHFVFSVYRHAVATVVLAPFALILERKTRPQMTLPVFWRILLLGFLEPVLDQNLYYLGMKYTSSTFASAAINILPAITFILAVIFRLEIVNMKKKHGLAKTAGTVIAITGAMVMSLYKGPAFNFLPSTGRSEMSHTETATDRHWVSGSIFVFVSCFCASAFYILQSMTLKMYPAGISLAALICLTGTVEGGAVTLAAERHMMVWIVGWDSRLLAILYSGIVCSGIAYYVQGAVMKERGPIFVTSFSPLCTVITAALSSIFLADKVHLGSLIGAVIVMFGLYTLIWGTSIDFETSKQSNHVTQLPITGDVAGKMVDGPAKPPVV